MFETVEPWVRELRYAGRALRRARGFSITVVLTLSLGIGASTAVFCAMDRLLLRALPYAEADRLVTLHETQTGKGFRPVSLANLLDWRAQSSAFDGVAGFMTRSFGLRGGSGDQGNPVSVIIVGLVTSDLFHVLGNGPHSGRTFSEQEEIAGSRVILISDHLWATQFNRARGIIGRSVQLNEEPYEVIGVLPPDFVFPDPAARVEACIPMNHRDYSARGVRPLQAVGHLKADVTVAGARAELRAIGARLAQAWPDDNVKGGADLETLDEAWTGSRRRPLLLLTAAAILLLAIVCTNVINVILARSLGRGREIAIRTALGANARTILRQMLAEAVLLSAGGGALGIFVAVWALEGLPAVLRWSGAPQSLPDLDVNGATLAFTSALCLLVTLLCGFAPALFMRSLEINTTIKSGSESGMRHGNTVQLRRALAIGQVALSLMLLLSAGAFLRAFLKLVNRDPGFETTHVYCFGFGLPEVRYTDRQMVEFHRNLRDRLQEIPGVEAAGAAARLPLNGRNNTMSFQFEGAALPQTQWPWAAYNIIDPDYFSALRIPLLSGRAFSWDLDRVDHPLAVIVNHTFERMYKSNDPLLGKRLQLRFVNDLIEKNRTWQIVGVVADTYQTGLDQPIRPQIYLPISQTGLDGGNYVIRTARTHAGLARSVAAAVQAVDPNLEQVRLRTLDRWVSDSLADRRRPAVLTLIFAIIGLLLTAIGVYGILALEVGERRRELAIRLALGASQTGLTRLVLVRGLVLTSIGASVGIVGFVAVGRALSSQLYDTAPVDAVNVAAGIAILFACAVCACLRPAWEAWRVQPVSILREI